MRALFSRAAGKAAEIGGKIVLQVTVSVAATVCVAGITGSFLKAGAPAATSVPQVVSSLDAGAAASLLQANFTEDGFRARVASVQEFSAVFGPKDDGEFTPPVARVWASDARAADPEADGGSSLKPRTAVAAACPGACSPLPSTGILPPVRPAVEAISLSQAAASSEAVSATSRVQLLGLSLPDLVPSPERLLTTVTSWSGAVADLVLK